MSNTRVWQPYLTFALKLIYRYILEFTASIVSPLIGERQFATPAIDDEILLIPAVKLSEKIKLGELTAEQVIGAYKKRIELVNPIINAVVEERFEKALNEARALDERLISARDGQEGDKSILKLPLVGVPFTVKETISLEGAPFTAGLTSRKLKRAQRSNPAVEQLIRSGLIPIASTNSPCMSMWWDCSNPVYGRTENPYDLSRTPGGSSGGEAAILAAAGSLVGVGSDLAGSLRIPCNFCGLFGHKPTPFAVSNEGVYPKMRHAQEKLRGVGPMARYAIDLLPMLRIMVTDREALARMRLDEPVDIRKIRIFYMEQSPDPLASHCNPDILAGFRAAVDHFSSVHQVSTEVVDLIEFKYGLSMWSAEFSVKEGKMYAPEHEDSLDALNPAMELAKKVVNKSEYPLNTIVAAYAESLGTGYGHEKHLHLIRQAQKLRKKLYDLLGDDGVFLMPTHPQPAPHHRMTLVKFTNVSYTAVGNTLQAPITQCPLGLTKEGLPFGLQAISKPYNDRLTLAVARELEKVLGGWLPPSRVAAKRAD